MFGRVYLMWMHKLFYCGSYETIRLVNVASEPGTDKPDPEFVPFTTRALDLIKRTDPRRYRTILREVRYISNSHIDVGGRYRRDLKRVAVNFPLYKVDTTDSRYDLYIAEYACMLVHEATHGRLFSLGVPYNKRTWERCERICIRESNRFASRLQADNYDPTLLLASLNVESYQTIQKPIMKARFILNLCSQLFFGDKK